MYTIRQISISISMFVSLSVLLLNASLISMDDGQDSGNQQDLVAGSQYEIVQNYPFAQPGYVDEQLRDPYIFISSIAKRLKGMDKYIEKSLSVLTEDERDDSIKARMKTIIGVARLTRLDIGRIQFDIKNFCELIKSGEYSEEKCKFVDLLGAWYGSSLIGKQQNSAVAKQAEKPSAAELLAVQKEIAAATQQAATVTQQNETNDKSDGQRQQTSTSATHQQPRVQPQSVAPASHISTEAQLGSQPQSEQVVANALPKVRQPQQRQDGGVKIGCGYHLPTCSCAEGACIANRNRRRR